MEANMRICTELSRLDLAKGHNATLRDAAGARIECLSGQLWITQHGDERDIVLGPGQSFTFDRNGMVIVNAIRSSQALVDEPPPAQPAAPWWSRLTAYWNEFAISRTAWRRAYRI
jgi:hypothetical protein